MADVRPAAGNIFWLASYPKSGNTWMRILLANYFGESDETHDINTRGVTNGIASSRVFFDEQLGIDSVHLTEDEAQLLRSHVYDYISQEMKDPLWLKVHDAQLMIENGAMMFPASATRGAVYIIRNPLDVCVSLAFHSGHVDYEKSSRQLCNAGYFLGGAGKDQLRQMLMRWCDHVASWTIQADFPVLVVRYEDMLADAATELSRVLRFAAPGREIDAERLQVAVDRSSFDQLQAAEQKDGFREISAKQKQFFRSGVAGDWKGKLSNQQIDRIRNCNLDMMARYGYA